MGDADGAGAGADAALGGGAPLGGGYFDTRPLATGRMLSGRGGVVTGLAAAAGSASELPQNLQNCAVDSATAWQREHVRCDGRLPETFGVPTGTIARTDAGTGTGGDGALSMGDDGGTCAGRAWVVLWICVSSVLPHDVQ